MIFAACGMASSAALAAMTEPYVSYTVKAGDTLEGLGRTLLTQPKRWPEVVKLNGIKNANKLSLGQVINVPRSLLNMGSQPRLAVPGKVISVQGDVKVCRPVPAYPRARAWRPAPTARPSCSWVMARACR
jgi:LysM repeat protein